MIFGYVYSITSPFGKTYSSLKWYNYEEYKKRLDLIRTIEPDYDPNETPKQRFKKKCELLKKK